MLLRIEGCCEDTGNNEKASIMIMAMAATISNCFIPGAITQLAPASYKPIYISYVKRAKLTVQDN